MKRTGKAKRLSLSATTIRNLQAEALSMAAGGVPGDSWDPRCSNSCNSCLAASCGYACPVSLNGC